MGFGPFDTKLTRRQFIKGLGLLIAGGTGLFGANQLLSWYKATQRPNFVFILADDVGHELLQCYGGVSYQTPHLNALAERGMRFTRCYSTPRCITSRVQLLTGQYQSRTGWYSFQSWHKLKYLDPRQHPIFFNLLRQGGYNTATAGKWQLCKSFIQYPNHPVECGFDSYCLIHPNSSRGYHNPMMWENGIIREKEYAGQFGPEVCNRFLIDFIRAQRQENFFVFYPMLLCHAPYYWPEVDEPIAGKTPEQLNRLYQKRRFPYMVETMDRLVGELVDALNSMGLLENTVIIFTADNGTEGGIRSKMADGRIIPGRKGTLEDSGIHVPLLVHYPQTIAPGQVCNDLVDLSDFFPTILDLAGIPHPENHTIDGVSFAPQIVGKPGPKRTWSYSGYETMHCLQTRDWKYVLDPGGPRLYHVASDPYGDSPITDFTGEAGTIKTELDDILLSENLLEVYL